MVAETILAGVIVLGAGAGMFIGAWCLGWILSLIAPEEDRLDGR